MRLKALWLMLICMCMLSHEAYGKELTIGDARLSYTIPLGYMPGKGEFFSGIKTGMEGDSGGEIVVHGVFSPRTWIDADFLDEVIVLYTRKSDDDKIYSDEDFVAFKEEAKELHKEQYSRFAEEYLLMGQTVETKNSLMVFMAPHYSFAAGNKPGFDFSTAIVTSLVGGKLLTFIMFKTVHGAQDIEAFKERSAAILTEFNFKEVGRLAETQEE